MTDPDARIRLGVTTLAEAERPSWSGAQVLARLEDRSLAATDPIPARSTGRPRAGVLVAVAAVLVAVLVAAVVAWRATGHEDGRVVVGPPTTAEQGRFPAGLHDWGSGPLTGTFNATPIWDGHRVVVLGGDLTATSDADRVAALDPTTGQWTTLPSVPFVPGSPDEGFVTGTACGGVVVAWDLDGQLAQLSPGAADWQSLPAASGTASNALGSPAYCTGDRLIWPTSGRAFSLRDRAWHPLAPHPGDGLSPAGTTWTGHQVIALVIDRGADPTEPLLYAYDPVADTWHRLASTRLWSGVGLSLTWTGARVVALDPRGRAASYDPATNRWTTLPTVPTSVLVPFATSVGLESLAGRAVVVGDHAIATLGTDDRWTVSSPAPPLGWSVVVDQALLTYAAGAQGPGLVSFVPPR